MNKIEENNNENDSQGGNTSNSDNINENGKRMKKRSTKKELYEKERNEIIKELNEIIGINENNNGIFLYELEKNEKIKEYIKNNIKRIRKYHKTGTWGYFSNDLLKGKGNEIGLIRTLYIDNDYDILSKLKINNFDNIKKQYTQLIFYKKQ
jgi:phosphoserine aminotransferase